MGFLVLCIVLVLGAACLLVWAGGDCKIDYPERDESLWERFRR